MTHHFWMAVWRLAQTLCVLVVMTSCASIATRESLANAPCGYLYRQPGEDCIDGLFELETEIGKSHEIVSSKVVRVATSTRSYGPVDPIAQCIAKNMAYYAKWHLRARDRIGLQRTTIYVVNSNACTDPRYRLGPDDVRGQ